jgi:hypothetical protein
MGSDLFKGTVARQQPLPLPHDLNPNNSHNNLVSTMPGDDKSEPPLPPPTMEGLAAQMTKLLSSMGDMETRMEARVAEPLELSRLKCAGHHHKGNTSSNALQTEQFLVCRVTS